MHFRKEERSIGKRLVALLCVVALIILMVPPEALTAIAAGEDGSVPEMNGDDVSLPSGTPSATVSSTVVDTEGKQYTVNSWTGTPESSDTSVVTASINEGELIVSRAKPAAYGEATVTVTATVTKAPVTEPSEEPSGEPSGEPSEEPSGELSEEPSGESSEEPSGESSEEPEKNSEEDPGNAPTAETINVPVKINVKVCYTLNLSLVIEPTEPIEGNTVIASLKDENNFNIGVLNPSYSWKDEVTGVTSARSSLTSATAGKKTVTVTVGQLNEGLAEYVSLPKDPITCEITVKPNVTAEFVTSSGELHSGPLTYGNDMKIRFTSTVAGKIEVGGKEVCELTDKDSSGKYANEIAASEANVDVKNVSVPEKTITYTFVPDDTGNYGNGTEGTLGYTVAKRLVTILVTVPDKHFDGGPEVKSPKFELAGGTLAEGDTGEIGLKNIEFEYVFSDPQAETVLNGFDTDVDVKIVRNGEPVLVLGETQNDNYDVEVQLSPNKPKLLPAQFETVEDVAYEIAKGYKDSEGVRWYDEGGVKIEIPEGKEGQYQISTNWKDGEGNSFGESITLSQDNNGKIVFYIREVSSGQIKKVPVDGIKVDVTAPNAPEITKVEKYSHDNTINQDHDDLNIDFASGSIAYTFTVTDNEGGSGIAVNGIDYAIIGSNGKNPGKDDWEKANAEAVDGEPNSYAFTVSAPEYGYVWVRVADNVGNVYNPTSSIRAAVVENEAPKIAKKSLDGYTKFDADWYSKAHTYEVTVTDQPTTKFSDIYMVTWSLSDSKGQIQLKNFETTFAPLSSINETGATPDETIEVKGHPVTIDLTPADDSVVLDGEYTVTVTATDFCGNEAAAVEQTLYFDNTAPEVTVSMKDGTTALNGETIYYSAEHSGITVDIRDEHNPVSYTVTLSQNNNTGNDNTVIIQKTEEEGTQNEDGSETVKITVEDIKKALESETLTDGEITISVTAADTTADEGHNGTEKIEVDGLIKVEGKPLSAAFTLDTRNPVLTKIVSSSKETPKGPFDETGYYYNDDVTLAFTVEDKNLKEIGLEYYKDGVIHNAKAPDKSDTVEVTLHGDATYTGFHLWATDMAGNQVVLAPEYEHAAWDEAINPAVGAINLKYYRVIDTVAPTATLAFTNCEPNYYGDEEDTFYYNGDINLMITGEDSYKSQVEVTLEDVEWKVTRKAVDSEDATVAGTLKDGKLEFEDTLSTEDRYSYEIVGTDRAGNPLQIIEKISQSDTKEMPVDSTSTSKIVVDKTAPKVKFNIETSASRKQLQTGHNNRYYFNREFTATYTITEANLDASKVKARFGHTDPTNYMSGSVSPSSSMSGNGTTYTYTSSADGLYIFDIAGADKAGNPLVLDGGMTTDIGNNPIESGLTSYVVVVDKVSPTMDLRIGSYYAADLTSSGYHVTANSPYRKESIAELRYSGADKSPVNVEYSLYSSISREPITQSSGQYSINASGNYSFKGEQILAVQALAISDLAGNRVQASRSVDGRVSNLIYLDVTPPTEDRLSPLVQLVAHESGQGRSVAGVDLYDGTVTVEATISEPGFQSALTGGKSSGIYAVYYEVLHNDGENWTSQMPGSVRSNGNAASSGMVTFASGSSYTDTKNETLTGRETVTFTFDAGSFNYNDISIRVWAEDNSGNLLAKENGAVYRFGIDTTAPSIEVSYDNNDAQNGKYFKADRTATVVVRERNFDPSRTVIDTQVGSSGSWAYAAGASANGDDDTWTTTVSYTADGDYTFNVNTTDLVGHRESSVSYGNSVAPQDFTIDKTNPLIEVTFDNEKVRNERYYDAPRTATILITEHNFDSSAAQVEPTASISEGSVEVPISSAWSSGGDANTATVDFLEDGDYTMTVNFTDMAGNQAQVYEVGLFTVDTTPPELTIDGVEDHMAYGDVNVTPSITYHDINYDDTSAGVQISGYKHTSGENLTGSRLDDAFGGSFIGDNIAKLRENDDIYTATGTVSDLAGNTTTATVVFSVNRFGSNYILGESTRSLVDKEEGAYYTNEAPVLEVTEINVNSLVTHGVDTSLNGTVTDLKEGVDYSINTVVDGWSETNYQIFSDNFEEEGTYVVTLTSTDEADNINTNRAVKWDGGVNSSVDLAFLVDKTAPLVYFTNVADNERYSEDERQVTVNFSDNTSIAKLTLSLDGMIIQELTGDDLSSEGVYEYIAQASNDWQELSVVAVDVAGNESELTSVRYLLTSNAFIQFFNNIPLLIGSVAGVFALAMLIFILLKRRKGNTR